MAEAVPSLTITSGCRCLSRAGVVDVVQIDGNRRRIALAFAVVGRHHERRRQVHLEVEQIAVGHRNLAGRGIDGEGRRARRAEQITAMGRYRIGAITVPTIVPVGRILAQAIKRSALTTGVSLTLVTLMVMSTVSCARPRLQSAHSTRECSLRLGIEFGAVLDGDVAVGGDFGMPAPPPLPLDREGMGIVDVDVGEGDFTHQVLLGLFSAMLND